MPDAVPSVAEQGFSVAFVQHEPLVRNYNSGLLKTESGTFLATRRFNREVWRCELVINRLVDGAAERICVLQLPRAHGMENFEDGRLFMHRGRIHVAYTEGSYYRRPWIAIQRLAVLRDNWSVERVITIEFGENTVGQEKNWQFFSHDGRLHFVYSVSPHVVVELDDSYRVARAHRTEPMVETMMRGGTPPVRVGDYYVTFPHFHIAAGKRTRRYGFSAYCFEARAPFRVVGITPPLVYASAEDPTLPNLAYPHWEPIVVFPCGAARDGDDWLVSAGINDSFDAIFRIPHRQLDFEYVLNRTFAA